MQHTSAVAHLPRSLCNSLFYRGESPCPAFKSAGRPSRIQRRFVANDRPQLKLRGMSAAAADTAADSFQGQSDGALPLPAKVLVVGATGRTGRRVVESLVRRGIKVLAGVRDVAKAESAFAGKESVTPLELNVLWDADAIVSSIDPAVDAVIIATGYAPPQKGGFPNLFEPWQVDKAGTEKVVDAARRAGIKRLVLVSSLLTNGAAWGQALNPAYLVLNLFGLILVAKLQAERYIQRSGINYTIVRPGGLRETPPSGNILASAQDTLARGSISRESVAEVAVESLMWPEASFKIVEIIEEADAPKKTFQQLFAGIP